MASSSDEKTSWYFAIGSMMHPQSLEHRNVIPLESHASEIMDHRIYFFSSIGFAEAIPAQGQTFHGVMHLVNEPTMQNLDKLEQGYRRTTAMARRYDTNELVECQVYTRDPNTERSPQVDKPPFQRYKEIMIQGAEHFGVDADYIAFLKNHPHQPRRQPAEFQSIGEVPEGAETMTLEQVKEYNGMNGKPLYCTVNGKVMECLADPESEEFMFTMGLVKAHGQVYDISLGKLQYDTYYGAPEKLYDFTHEHSAYIEDLLCQIVSSNEAQGKAWKIICHFDQKWKNATGDEYVST
jgi:predicted heme/steroid binding protein/gamma-glutamylcyclotransferase (GGCT)/AIG2-like uncharacterized protein YtfP